MKRRRKLKHKTIIRTGLPMAKWRSTYHGIPILETNEIIDDTNAIFGYRPLSTRLEAFINHSRLSRSDFALLDEVLAFIKAHSQKAKPRRKK